MANVFVLNKYKNVAITLRHCSYLLQSMQFINIYGTKIMLRRQAVIFIEIDHVIVLLSMTCNEI